MSSVLWMRLSQGGLVTMLFTGELAKGRTSILVTHQVGLCLPISDYVVLVEGGTASGSKPTARIEEKVSALVNMEPTIPALEGSQATSGAPKTTKLRPQQSASRTDWKIFFGLPISHRGIQVIILGVLITLGYQLCVASHSWWLSRWTAHQDIANNNSMLSNIDLSRTFSRRWSCSRFTVPGGTQRGVRCFQRPFSTDDPQCA